ncbi:SpoIVB peptidase [Pseudoflavonifractor sp. DSM 107456]|uniref:SpoIVB peptidase n=1 Tax=Pseudoflavonifractor gallinarum TaxID=2779352 RepID=A0ABR9RBY3_9FIRM|nr:SpoIVB peptidase [Pseudoflavonifractor gallinarum]MBE5056206.1 SpoIVB peptidase [Pseudoflavonifractor gallinarum]
MREESNKQPWGALALRVVAMMLSLGALLAVATPVQASAAQGHTVSRTVIPMGRAVGIKLFSDGVMVVGLADIETEKGTANPAKTCGLKEGDIITHLNQEEVDSIEEVQAILQETGGEAMSIRAKRGEEEVQMTVQAVQCSTDGSYKLGAWIRDSMAGIGTITFYDPTSGVFGALGHGISDMDTAKLMPLQSGSIMFAEVSDVQKGAVGAPGQLRGAFQVEQDLGELYANTSSGIFGTWTGAELDTGMEPIPVAQRSEVRTGKATIRSNVAGTEIKEYEVEIVRLYPESSGEHRDLMLKVTDETLLKETGGIVQGMSGSPIIQNGKLVGAVTHVLVNDPTQGYGILAENMLKTAEES